MTCDSVGCRDVVDDGVNGLLVPPRSPTLLAQALKKLLDSPDLRARMGLAARAKAEREFDIASVVATHLAIYRELSPR